MEKDKTLCYSCKHRFIAKETVYGPETVDFCLMTMLPLDKWMRMCNGYDEGLRQIYVVDKDNKIGEYTRS